MYLKKYRKTTYATPLTDNRLNVYLVNMNKQAEYMFFLIFA